MLFRLPQERFEEDFGERYATGEFHRTQVQRTKQVHQSMNSNADHLGDLNEVVVPIIDIPEVHAMSPEPKGDFFEDVDAGKAVRPMAEGGG
jgi:hypothetical protein